MKWIAWIVVAAIGEIIIRYGWWWQAGVAAAFFTFVAGVLGAEAE